MYSHSKDLDEMSDQKLIKNIRDLSEEIIELFLINVVQVVIIGRQILLLRHLHKVATLWSGNVNQQKQWTFKTG